MTEEYQHITGTENPYLRGAALGLATKIIEQIQVFFKNSDELNPNDFVSAIDNALAMVVAYHGELHINRRKDEGWTVDDWGKAFAEMITYYNGMLNNDEELLNKLDRGLKDE